MSSTRRHEGYFLIDNRGSPGIPDEAVQRFGLPSGANRGVFETPTYTCKHCTRVVIMNPLRTRERHFCQGCSHYICDECTAKKWATGECVTWDQIAEETQEAAVKQTDSGIIISK